MSDTKFDLDALEVEAKLDPFTFTFGGEDYEIPAQSDLRVTYALKAGDWTSAIQLLLGPDQWARVMASPAVLDMERAVALVQAYTVHIGSTVGESSASSRSSKSTGRPSKRTSNGSSESDSQT